MMDEKARNDCIKEIDLLKSLDHVNVIKYFESFIENDAIGVAHGAYAIAYIHTQWAV